MMPKTLVLHIGSPKTGTTTIQKQLAREAHYLKSSGVLACISESKSRDLGRTLMGLLCDSDHVGTQNWLIENGISFGSRHKYEKTLESQLKKLSHTSFDRILASAEDMFWLREYEIDRLRKILSKFFTDIKVVCYLRRQDEFHLSRFSTMVKGGYAGGMPSLAQTRFSKLYNYHETMSKWARIFGKENIVIRPYLRRLQKNKDLLCDFWSSVGIPGEPLSNVVGRENIALSARALSFLIYVNPYLGPKYVSGYRNPLRKRLIEACGECIKGPELGLPEREKGEAMRHFDASNAKLIDEFGLRSDFFGPSESKKDRTPGLPQIDLKEYTEIWVTVCKHFGGDYVKAPSKNVAIWPESG